MTGPRSLRHPPRERFLEALWYAWGQQDAGIGRDVDAFDFANHHADQAEAYRAERVGSLCSVQDAWRTFTNQPLFQVGTDPSPPSENVGEQKESSS